MKRFILSIMAGMITMIAISSVADHSFPVTDIYPGLTPVYILQF